jgi:hypothetical protein
MVYIQAHLVWDLVVLQSQLRQEPIVRVHFPVIEKLKCYYGMITKMR